MRRGEIWDINTRDGSGRVLVLSINEANQQYQAAVVVILRPVGVYPDTMLSVILKEPVAAIAFGMNLMQVTASRFAPASGAVKLGSASDADMARVWGAVRSVLSP